MIINAQSLDLAFKGFQTVYNEAKLAAPSHAMEIAMAVPSSARDETYGWLGAFPQLREWVGPRHVKGLKAHGFTIVNRKFESTVSVARDDIADDRLGVFKPMFSEMGTIAARHPDELVFELLKSGFDAACFDGQNFFDTDHPLEDANGDTVTVSNMQAGGGPGWYMLDVSRGVRPIIWQEREGYEFTSVNRHDDAHVFTHDAYIYGVRARVNAGFGLKATGLRVQGGTERHQLCRRARRDDGRTGDGGKVLGITPSVLVVPPALEDPALRLLNSEFGTGGESNPWKDRRMSPMPRLSSRPTSRDGCHGAA